jgi:hypothetical protein
VVFAEVVVHAATTPPGRGSGSLEWGLACAMVYGFQRFQAQIKVKDEGFSPRGTMGGGGHQKVVRDCKTSALILSDGGRELQGADLTGSS